MKKLNEIEWGKKLFPFSVLRRELKVGFIILLAYVRLFNNFAFGIK